MYNNKLINNNGMEIFQIKVVKMKVLVGTDIIEIKRVKESIQKYEKEFIKRIYTEKEIEYCESKHNAKYQHYAVRFAAKEAIFKAVSKLLEDKFEISWQNAEIINNKDGKPEVRFIDTKIKDKIKSIDISLSHCKEYATANVIVIV